MAAGGLGVGRSPLTVREGCICLSVIGAYGCNAAASILCVSALVTVGDPCHYCGVLLAGMGLTLPVDVAPIPSSSLILPSPSSFTHVLSAVCLAAALKAVRPAAGPPGSSVSLYGRDPFTDVIGGSCSGGTDCVSEITFGDFLCPLVQGPNAYSRWGRVLTWWRIQVELLVTSGAGAECLLHVGQGPDLVENISGTPCNLWCRGQMLTPGGAGA